MSDNFDPLGWLTQGTQRLQQTGAYGIPNIGALQALMKRQSEFGARRASAMDAFQLDRSGFGRSVAKGFSSGARYAQFNQSLLDALTKLQAEHGRLQGSQIASMLGSALPIAHQEATKPSWFSTMIGGLLGLGGQAFMPGLASKVVGNPQMDLIERLLGLSQPSGGTGMATMANFPLSRRGLG